MVRQKFPCSEMSCLITSLERGMDLFQVP